jgi:hypothetical protein
MLKEISDNLAAIKHVGVNTLIVTSPTLRSNIITGKAKPWLVPEEGFGM